MQVTKVIDSVVRVKAIYTEDGKLALAVTATAPYGNRTVTSTIDTFSQEIIDEVSAVLANVLETEGQRAVLLAEQEAVIARTKALALGEAV